MSQSDQAGIILKSALLNGVWGPPAHCLVRQEIETMGRTVRGTGKYARGTVGEMKLVLKIVAGDFQNRLEQVSDSRRLRVVLRMNGKEEGYHVNLMRVGEYLGQWTESDRSDPMVALHLSIGGQNEKLRALCQQYKWTKVTEGKYTQPGHTQETDVWWLYGVRNLESPVLRGTAKIDALLAGADGLQMAPASVRLAIGRGGTMPFWLYFVEESRAGSPKEPTSRLIATIDYHEPTLAKMPPGTFEAEDFASSAGTDIDETSMYEPPPRHPTHTASRP